MNSSTVHPVDEKFPPGRLFAAVVPSFGVVRHRPCRFRKCRLGDRSRLAAVGQISQASVGGPRNLPLKARRPSAALRPT